MEAGSIDELTLVAARLGDAVVTSKGWTARLQAAADQHGGQGTGSDGGVGRVSKWIDSMLKSRQGIEGALPPIGAVSKARDGAGIAASACAAALEVIASAAAGVLRSDASPSASKDTNWSVSGPTIDPRTVRCCRSIVRVCDELELDCQELRAQLRGLQSATRDSDAAAQRQHGQQRQQRQLHETGGRQ